ncbi:MAG: neutral/alkaline non-lysosomal ceramidase N-terminal domain-containing protein [Blastocatellia bacterium]
MKRWFVFAALALIALTSAFAFKHRPSASKPELRVGAAAVAITPFGQHPDWDGQVTQTGVWGEKFNDKNGNGVWDGGEEFEDDDGNTAIDQSSKNKYDGIYLAGFGDKRLATGRHDDLWARTVVLEYGQTRIAIVAVDFIGYYSEGSYYGVNHIQKLVDPKLGIREILVASTHNHEGPDTIGAWGDGPLKDGKYPKYLRFVDKQIARSIAQAAGNLQSARLKLGVTDPVKSPSIAGMQTRTGGRPPKFFDEELRVMQFTGAANKTIATIINWNTHPESMEDKNTLLTSDFPHAIRETVEKRYGGAALFINGAIGAAEIIGDTNNKSNDRIRFDSKDYPLDARSNRPVFTFERTEAIGRDVAKAAIEALDRGEWSKSNQLEVKKADLKCEMDNQGYLFLAKLGVFDTIPVPADGPESKPPQFKTWIYAITLGDAQIVTTPGELFPEIFYGVAKHKRSDCPQADTGQPPEPSIRDAMTAKYRFMFGLCPDEFGYIVPRYDWRREPVDLQKMQIKRSVDPCKEKGVPNHYHETNSASSELAPASACVTVALLTGKIPNDAACKDLSKHSDFAHRLRQNSRGRTADKAKDE